MIIENDSLLPFIANEFLYGKSKRETKKEGIRTLLNIKDDAHLTTWSEGGIAHSFADVCASMFELDVGYLQATVDVSTAGWQRKAVTAYPPYPGT